ncbi:PREDICTED: translation initiation factor IF-2-like [Lepidothrix coronata]|uniref:Translation initiation factor IF-2-like n=1 Tax=Lepidothrix coronata TaxID=321398 RepID=A0A6J0IM97_9PASS|nr:PREDICTED: translation initiation factor IF-2-like [Lepidothrix coronata]
MSAAAAAAAASPPPRSAVRSLTDSPAAAAAAAHGRRRPLRAEPSRAEPTCAAAAPPAAPPPRPPRGPYITRPLPTASRCLSLARPGSRVPWEGAAQGSAFIYESVLHRRCVLPAQSLRAPDRGRCVAEAVRFCGAAKHPQRREEKGPVGLRVVTACRYQCTTRQEQTGGNMGHPDGTWTKPVHLFDHPFDKNSFL